MAKEPVASAAPKVTIGNMAAKIQNPQSAMSVAAARVSLQFDRGAGPWSSGHVYLAALITDVSPSVLRC